MTTSSRQFSYDLPDQLEPDPNAPPPPAAPRAPAVPRVKPAPKRRKRLLFVQYDVAVRTGAEVVAILFWTMLWCLDGIGTVWTLTQGVEWLTGRINARVAEPVLIPGLAVILCGIALHVMISLAQQHLWKTGQPLERWYHAPQMLTRLRTWESIVIGSLNTCATAYASFSLLLWLGLAGGPASVIVVAVYSLFSAMAPEPALRYHGVGIVGIMKGRAA